MLLRASCFVLRLHYFLTRVNSCNSRLIFCCGLSRYEILDANGAPSLAWRYEALRLWQMEAKELLALGQPALLALTGLTRLREPERVLPKVMAKVQKVEDEIQRNRILTMLTSLIDDKEVLEMVEKILDPLDEYLMEFPYQKRIRQQAREEGREEGRKKGIETGIEEGIEKGILTGLREAILEAVALRFNPAALEYRRVNRQLEDLTKRESLQRLHAAAIQAEDMATFVSRLDEEMGSR